MATIYKPTYTKDIPPGAEIVKVKGRPHARFRDQRGKLRTEPLTADGTKVRREQKKWRIEYTDANGVRQRKAGYTDRKATEQLAAELERSVAHEQSGLVDKFAEHRKRPLDEHVTHWHNHSVHKGTTQKQVGQLRSRVLRVINGCGFTRWPDLSAAKVQGCIAELRKASQKKGSPETTPGSASNQTKNFYLQAIKQFCRWMVHEGRAPDSPLAHLQGWNVRLDRRHDRRAFTDVELRLLLHETARGPLRFGMVGSDRALLYLLAVETGLRAGEIRSLTTRSFDLDSRPPAVAVEAAYSKHRREDIQPLRPQFVQVMAEHLRDREPDAPLFRMPEKTARMLRADLADARSAWIDDTTLDNEERKRREQSSVLVYRDEAGRVLDFHAFRHTFITNLARAGVHPKQAQDLARHADINMTLGRYTHTVLADRAEALAALPDLRTHPDQERVRATGTDGESLCSSLRTSLRGPRTSEGLAVSPRGTETRPEAVSRERLNPEESDAYDRDGHEVSSPDTLRRTGFEPVTFGSVDRCSIQLS